MQMEGGRAGEEQRGSEKGKQCYTSAVRVNVDWTHQHAGGPSFG